MMTGLSVSVREPGVRHGAQRGHRGRGPGGGVVRVSNPTGGEVATHVQASPDVVYGLVSDVRRMGEWSPETYWCEWTGGATGAEVGARFRACNRRGLLRWRNTPEVITATPGAEFSFRRRVAGNVVVWRYRMVVDRGGTRLSESYEVLTPTPAALNRVVLIMMGVRDRHADLMNGMHLTLDRLRIAAEAAEVDGRPPW